MPTEGSQWSLYDAKNLTYRGRDRWKWKEMRFNSSPAGIVESEEYRQRLRKFKLPAALRTRDLPWFRGGSRR